MRATLLFVLCGAAMATPLQKPAPKAHRPAAAAPADPAAAADRLFHDYWEHALRTSPELATFVGDPRYNDRISDPSLPAIRRDFAAKRRFLAAAEALPETGLDPERRTSRALMIWQLKDALDGERFRFWEMPLSQMEGLHIDFPALFSSHPFHTLKDYRDFVSRLRAFPKAMDATITNLRAGLKEGIVPTRLVVEAVITQVKPMTEGATSTDPFLDPLRHCPPAITPAQQRQLRRQVDGALKQGITPAYRRLLAFLEHDYLPAARPEPGFWAMKDGEARYAYLVRHHTTTDLTPEQIHATGLAEVTRIEGEMLAIAKSQGYPDLAAFRAAVAKNDKLHPKDAADLVARYKAYVDGMRPELPKLFGRLPKAPLAVVPMEAFREQGAAAADYNAGTPDGSRPGRFSVNTFQAKDRSTLSIESTSYHEALPGHHLQISLAQEMEGLPDFRKHMGIAAFEEGWALYSERLPKELGFYQDPYSDYGRLGDEMLRAIRLVLDTGVHAKRWTREEMVAFFRAHGTNDEVELQSETDRYIAWPGQALSYKTGQLTILRLREKAKAELGARFDLRAFHDLVLGGGAMPLSVLEQRVDDWIAEEKK
ncbi:MAG TPA: DUF885 domain-containing protein [Holophagaceae bacterium]|nr:DUF885 domain-containing protein [Holophagaceae bacterium]